MNKPFFAVLTALALSSGALAQDLVYTVQKGDTAFSLARRFSMPLEELLAYNGLESANLRLGQVLNIPQPDAAPAVEAASGALETLSIRVTAPRLPVAMAGVQAQSAPRIQPPAPSSAPEAKAAQTPAGFYTVQKGDTAYSVARAFGLGVDALLSINGLSSSALTVGQVLKVGKATSSAPVPAVVLRPESGRNAVSFDLASATVQASPALSSEMQTYRVQRGETLFTIAKALNVSVSALQEANALSSSDLPANFELIVPALPDPAPTLSPSPAPDPAPPASSSSAQSAWRQKALSLLGVPYVWGGKSARGTDCSGFVIQVMAEVGVNLPRRSSEQYGAGVPVSFSELQEGDLVFFNTTGSGVSHVGIYLEGGKFINANSYVEKVAVDDLGSSYWAARFVGARRVLGAGR